MPRFLAIYSLQPEDLAKFRALPKSEQDRIDNEGIALWKVWEQQHAAAFADPGGIVGKTLRVSRTGTAPPPTPSAATWSSKPKPSKPPPKSSKITPTSAPSPATQSTSCLSSPNRRRREPASSIRAAARSATHGCWQSLRAPAIRSPRSTPSFGASPGGRAPHRRSPLLLRVARVRTPPRSAPRRA